MADPTPVVRAVTYERDSEKCVSCGATTGLQYQHRQAVGMGGSKRRPRLDEGLTSCAACNPAYESTLQESALRFGWKVKKWVKDCALVPVYYPLERAWFRLSREGGRVRVSPDVALQLMVEVYGAAYDVEKELSA